MRTVLVGIRPPEVEEWLERRRVLGQDLFDEVWEGDYHVAPAPHGRHGQLDFQLARILGPIADAAGLRGAAHATSDDRTTIGCRIRSTSGRLDQRRFTIHPTAAVVVEIVSSPGDESRDRLGFYERVGVDEVLIVDPEARTVEWLVRDGRFRP